jgi:hypothetical protein
LALRCGGLSNRIFKLKSCRGSADEVIVNSTFDDHPHPATIQIPTGEPNGSKLSVPSTFSAMEGKRLILESTERIGMSTPVSVEYNDAMFLGEVMLCKPISEGNYRVEIFVEQILTGLQSLMALRAGLLGDSQAAPAPRALAPVNLPARPQSN